MKDRPEGVADADLIAALADGWGYRVRSVTYRPVGAGSYHWTVRDEAGPARFVTVDDLGVEDQERDHAFDTLRRALGTAVALRHDAGLDFVVAPLPTRVGAPALRLGPRYAMSVYPLLAGEAGQFGAHRSADRPEVVRLLAALHAATPVVADRAPRVELTLPGRDLLHDALRSLDVEWTAGPYAERVRRLLADRAGHVARLLGDFDALVSRVRATATDWVVTHGEPHPGNLIRGRKGLRLIDWETVRIAPPERDLWLVAGDDLFADRATTPSDLDEVSASYRAATGRSVDPAGLDLYRLWWELADIASFLDDLRRPHRDTEDAAAAWHHLRGYLG